MTRLSFSLESIDFQSGAFFKELTLAFGELKKKNAKELRGDGEASGHISKIIKNHTGLKVSFDLTNYGPMVEVPHLNKNHPLIADFHRDYVSSADAMRMIGEASGLVHGTVNLKTGKVTGVFSDMVNKLYFPADMVTGTRYTAAELAAVCLHEIGHLFTYCEYMSRSVTTNQILAGLAKGLGQASSAEEREAVLISTKKALHLDLDTGELAKEKDNSVTVYVVISNITRTTADEIGFNIYDLNSWEALSDQYAARQGAHKDLAVALDKIYRLHGNISFRTTSQYLAVEAMKASLLTANIILKAISIAGLFTPISSPLSPLAHFGATLLTDMVWVMIAMDGMGDGSYDRPGIRLKRLRNQIVEEMKNKKISADDGQRLTEDLLAVDEVLKFINDREQFVGKLWNLFSSDARKRITQEKLTSELEDLASNDLFASSLRLRQAATA